MKAKISPPLLYKWFIGLMLSTIFLPVSRQIKFPYNLVGALIFIAGAYIAIHTKKMFRKPQTPVSHRANPEKLHTGGIFRFTRNPMYLGISIGLAGISIVTGIIANLFFPILYIVIMDIFFVRDEEKLLDEKFGLIFRQYKKKTRRWL